MTRLILVPVLLSAVLPITGCATAARPPAMPASTGQSARYVCADGRQIEVLYSAGDAAVVTLGDRTIEMRRAPSAEGERYVGGGLQWWGRGQQDGRLGAVPEGEAAAAGGTACHVG